MKAPWNIFRGRGDSARKIPARRPLTVEVLEDRLVLSTVGPVNNPSANDWRNLTFQINNQTPASISGTVTSQSMEDSSLIGLPQVMADYSYRGTGYTVAVIDTGIDYNNPYLGGGWGDRVIGGWNFVANNDNPMDDNGHGTSVAGIIGSSDPSDLGIAPNVDFVALKVLDSTGSGTFGNVDLALQWVAANAAKYNIVAVNMSLGSGNYTANPFTFLESDFQALVSDGIFISVAAGNSYFTYGSAPGLAYPAVSPQVVSVGAVWDGNYGSVTWVNGAVDNTTAPGLITSFTQRDASLDILAPGAMITTETLDDQFATEAGTSMSTPVITGAAVLLHQALDALGEHSMTSQQDLLAIMQNTGTSVVDGDPAHDNVVNTGLTFKMLNLYAALSSLSAATPPPATPPPTTTPTPGQSLALGSLSNQTMTAGQSLVVNLSATGPAGLTLTYSAQLQGAASEAYLLQQQLGLSYMGSYFYNSWGQDEKWLLGSGSIWYCVTPDGDLRKWAGTMAATMLPSGVVASLGTAYYNDPSLVWNAAAPSAPPVTLSVTGSKLTITAPASYTGSFQVNVTVSDGQSSAAGSFQVAVNAAPTIQFPSTESFSSSTGSGTITLPGTDASGHAFSYAAALGGSSALAVQLEKSLGLLYLGSYFQNLFGQNEKWLGSASGQLYFLLPNGQLRKFTGTMTASLTAGNLIASLDPADYTNPQLVWSPVQPTFQVAGDQVTVNYPKGFVGTFVVNVTATDNGTVTTQTIAVTVSSSTSTGSSSVGKASDVAAAPVETSTPSSGSSAAVPTETEPVSSGTVSAAPTPAVTETVSMGTPDFASGGDNTGVVLASANVVQTYGSHSNVDQQQPTNTLAPAMWLSEPSTPYFGISKDDRDQAAGTEFTSAAIGQWLADNPI